MPKLFIFDAFTLLICEKTVTNYALLRCKTFSLKIWLCKIFDKFRVWSLNGDYCKWVFLTKTYWFVYLMSLCEATLISRMLILVRTPGVHSRKNFSAIKKANQIAYRNLNIGAWDLNWWRPCNHERKLLTCPEHTFHWKQWHTSCSVEGKYG